MAAKGIKYTETNSATIEDETFAGTTQEITVIAIPEKAEGETEQEKIDKALANPNKSEPSDTITVTFPMKPPAKPTGFKTTDIGYNFADFTWTAPSGAQSYTIEQEGKAIKYIETNKITITDETFNGKTIKFTVTAYPRKYTGKDEAEEIKNAQNSGEASPKSDVLSVEFLLRPSVPTNIRVEDLTSKSATVLCDAGSENGVAWVGHRNNDGDEDPKEAKVLDYTEKREIKLTPEFVGVPSLAGMTIIYYFQEFNVKGQGETDQDKAKYLNENELGSEWTSALKIVFPKESVAETPTNIKEDEVTSNSGSITWTRGSSNGKSTTIEYNDGSSVGIDYTEETTYTLTDKIFGESLAGKNIKFTLIEYNDTYPGATSKNKADNAQKSKKGSPASEPLTIEFPSEENRSQKLNKNIKK